VGLVDTVTLAAPSVSTAVSVLASARVDAMSNVTRPLAGDVAVGGTMVVPNPLAVRATVTPLNRALVVLRAVTRTV
jgi:hypothetical protein